MRTIMRLRRAHYLGSTVLDAAPRGVKARREARSSLMDRVDPGHLFRLFDRLDVEIDHHGLVVAAHQHAFERLVRAGIDLLVRHVWRHEDEITRAGLGGELE